MIDSVTIPFGIKTSHTWHEVGAIFRVINNYKIEFFVELGTYQGGLLSLLNARSRYDNKFKCISFENNVGMIHPKSYSELANIIIIGDCQSAEHVQMVRDKISSHHKSIIYCDNGNKVKEAGLYAPVLKSGDILLIHDYLHDWAVRDIPNYGEIDFPTPEVFAKDLDFLFDDLSFEILPEEYLRGTRIMGFEKI